MLSLGITELPYSLHQVNTALASTTMYMNACTFCIEKIERYGALGWTCKHRLSHALEPGANQIGEGAITCLATNLAN